MNLAKAVNPGKTGKIKVGFSLKVPKVSCRQSYFITDRNDASAEDIVICLGPFLPTLPVYENGTWAKGGYFPYGECFYTRCSDYNVHLEVPVGYEACATGSEKQNDDGSCDFEATNVRDFLLMTGKNLSYTQETVNGINVRV